MLKLNKISYRYSESTNHMDLESITAVEESLVNFNGSLLLANHDQVFLDNIISVHWKIERSNKKTYALKIL